MLKKNYNQKKRKEEENIKNKIHKISELFDELKNKNINSPNKEIKDIQDNIKKIFQDNNSYNNYNFEMLEIKTEDYLNNKISNEKKTINELKSYIDLINIEYKKNEFNIQYFSQIILLICKLINEKSNIINIDLDDDEIDLKNKDDTLVNEIIDNVRKKINEFQMKHNENENNNEIYSFLNRELKKIMDIIDKDNLKNEMRNNNYLYSTNRNLEYNNYKSDLKPNIQFNKQNNMINNKFININDNYNDNFNDNCNDNNYQSIILNNFNKLDKSLSSFLNYKSPRNINKSDYSFNYNKNLLLSKNPNIISNINQNKINNSNYNTRYNNNYNNNNNNEINYEEILPEKDMGLSEKDIVYNNMNNIDSNNSNNTIPKLPNEIINMFSDELINIYNNIIQFLENEFIKIEEEIKELDKKKESNNKLKELKDTNNFNQYNNLFSQIFENENKLSNNSKKTIEEKLKIYNMIKSNYEETLNFICNNEFRHNIFKDKLNIILTNINDYYQMCDSINKKRNKLNLNYISLNNNDINNLKSSNFIMNNNYEMYMDRNNNKINIFKSSYNNNIDNNNYKQNGGYNRYNNDFFD